jgi:hypothetical protein
VYSRSTINRPLAWVRIVVGLIVSASCAANDCDLDAVHDHVHEQFARFGPMSFNREYFGYIYSSDGKIASAVVRSNECRGDDRCFTNTTGAARAIPKHARLLGEWHTHPLRVGSRALSADDVRGAHQLRHIPCYQAYYSTPRGEIYAWNITQTSVTTAMSTRLHLGNFFAEPLPLKDSKARYMALR